MEVSNKQITGDKNRFLQFIPIFFQPIIASVQGHPSHHRRLLGRRQLRGHRPRAVPKIPGLDFNNQLNCTFSN